MSKASIKEAAAAQREAQALWKATEKERDAMARKERDKAKDAELKKTTRLRELRLAKEAADRDAAEQAAEAKKAVKRKPPMQVVE